MAELMGRWPEPTPPEGRVEERVDLGDIVRERISYNVEPGERIPASARYSNLGSAAFVNHLVEHVGLSDCRRTALHIVDMAPQRTKRRTR